jgi:protein CpxP
VSTTKGKIMKTLTSLLLASALVAAPIATSYAHQHTDKSDMPMMDSQMMKKMQTHMEEMQAVLDAVKSESDPEKREAMLHEHAQKMQDMMGMMEGKDSMGMKDGKGMKGGMGMKHKHSDMSTDDKMKMMEQRMAMMEDMMGQMMGHTAEKAKPIHKHKKN